MENFREIYNNSGFIPSPKDDRDYKLDKLVKSAVKLPHEYLNTTTPIIFDQGESSTCVGCALAQAKHLIEYKQLQDKGKFSPLYIYSHRHDDDYQGEGMITREALKSLKDFGMCHYADFPGFYSFKDGKALYELDKENLDKKAYPYRISSYYRLHNINDIKTAIFTLGFALVAYDVYPCMYQPDENGRIIYDKNNPGECDGGHQMIALGWDDYGLIVCNSWSEDYGVGIEENNTNGGMIFIPYEYKPTEAWACTDEIREKEVQTMCSSSIFSRIRRFFYRLYLKIKP